MKSKPITIRDVAREIGVSAASVSRALNGLSGVSEETKNQILEVCEKLGYVPNTLARGLVLQRTHTIGIIMPDISSPFYSRLMILAASKAKEFGYQVLLCNSFRNYDMEVNYFNLLIGNQVEGVLFFPVGEESSKYVNQFMHYVPIVSLNQMPKESPIPYVCADEYASGKLATEYLIKCGCKNLLYIGYTSEGIAYRNRVKSFLETIKKAKVYGEVYESSSQYKGGFEQGYQKFSEFLDKNLFIPDGVVASSDEAANGVLKACIERNIAIPQEMSLIGFDNINANLPTLELTSVAISHQQYIQKALEFLISMKENRTIKKDEKAIYLKPQLFERNSCNKKVIL